MRASAAKLQLSDSGACMIALHRKRHGIVAPLRLALKIDWPAAHGSWREKPLLPSNY
jgi:hypothetical protein